MQNLKSMALFLAVVLALAAGYYFLFATEAIPNYTYSGEQRGVAVYSNEKPIIDYFNELADQNHFVLSPSMFEQGELNSFASQGLNLLQVVLLSNKKDVVFMIKVHDTSQNFVYCQTNYGSEKVNEKISVDSCQSYLQTSPAVRIETKFPNPKLKKPYVVLEKNTIVIYPRVKEDIPGVSFLAANALYLNAPSIIGQFNYLADAAASNNTGGK